MITYISDIHDPVLADFVQLTDVELRKSQESARGLYLAESLKVITRAIEVGHQPRAFLLLEEWLPKIQPLLDQFVDVPVFVGDAQQITELTGFHMHRGAIASMHRPPELTVADLLATSQRVVILDDLSDHTNVGAIFRSVAALGADAVLLTRACADPLYRRAVRVSMGAVLQVPWARLPHWREAGPLIREAGFEIIGLGLSETAENLETFVLNLPKKFALVFGSEGPGLSRQAVGASNRIVTIPMEHGVDSLNVATSAAITLWAVRSVPSRNATTERE